MTGNPAVGGIAGTAVGAAVCRSTIANPTNGCLPLNLFGEGSLGAGATAWVTGESDGLRTRQDLDIALDVYAIDAQYSPFSTWAGPVSFAAGFEYREESFRATSDATSQARRWFVGNPQPGAAGYNVKEVFGEVLLPLLKDSAVGDFELNGAVRRTDYSTSGAVTTWKVGGAYRFGDLRLRATRSRDIRAPNLNDLFAPQSQFVNQFLDRSLPNSPLVQFVTLSGGNPNLTPEIADTWTVGGVYQPSWAPGLTATVDWYKIDIKDALFGVGGQLLLDLCYGFNRPASPSACQSIVPVAGSTGLTGATLLTGAINAQNVEVEGIDYEISYRTNLSNISDKLPGSLNLRVLASQRLADRTALPGDTTPPDLGAPQPEMARFCLGHLFGRPQPYHSDRALPWPGRCQQPAPHRAQRHRSRVQRHPGRLVLGTGAERRCQGWRPHGDAVRRGRESFRQGPATGSEQRHVVRRLAGL